MPTELILSDSRTIQLPEPKTPGALQLWPRLDRMAKWLPPGVPAEQFCLAVSAEANRLSKDVNAASVVKTAFNCAVVGLIPGSALGHAFFIPFGKQCQLVIGYKGFLDLAYGCGFLSDIQCDVVLQGETYRRWNDRNGAQIEHDLPIDRNLDYRLVQAAYCVWHSKAGGHGIEVVTRKQLDKVKTRNETKKGSVWKTDPISMTLKTPIRRASPKWKMTDRLGHAVTLDGLAEVGEPQPALTGEDDEPARPSLADIPDETTDLKDEASNIQADEAGPFDEPDGKVLRDHAPPHLLDDHPEIVQDFLDSASLPETDLDKLETEARANVLLGDKLKVVLAAIKTRREK